jgi:hypothetical protein
MLKKPSALVMPEAVPPHSERAQGGNDDLSSLLKHQPKAEAKRLLVEKEVLYSIYCEIMAGLFQTMT